MSPNDTTPYQLPVVGVDAGTLDERHWRRLSHGTLIRAFDQAYLLMPPPHWQLSCFVKADNQRVTGRTSYRRPSSVRAWSQVAWPVFRKWLAHLTKRKLTD